MKVKLKFFLLSVTALALGIAVMIISVLKTCSRPVRAEVSEPSLEPILNPQEDLVSDEGEVGETVKEEKNDYFLAYPGILPDNPFYWLKMIRDRLLLTLSTSSQKTEKLLLYADKRLGAGKSLIEKNKVQLGVTTVTKGEKYLEKAVLEWEKTKDDEFKNRLSKAIDKHEEVLKEIVTKAEGSEEVFNQMISKLMDLRNLLK